MYINNMDNILIIFIIWHIYLFCFDTFVSIASEKLSVKNFTFYTQASVYIMYALPLYEQCFKFSFSFIYVCSLITLMSITPEIFVLENSNFTHVSIKWTIFQVFFM